MGSTSSTLNSLKQNPHLQRFASHTPIPGDDNKYWNELLSFSFSSSRRTGEDSKVIEDTAGPLLESFLQNNLASHNLGGLVKVFLDRASQLRSLSIQDSRYALVLWQTFNSLYILRCCSKHLVQTLTEDNLLKHFVAVHVSEGQVSTGTQEAGTQEVGTQTIEQLISTLIRIVVDVPLDGSTYMLHVEAMTTLLVLLSVQMYSARPAQKSFIYKTVMQKKCAIHALLLTKCLLTNFIKQEPAPKNEGGSIILGLASGIWNVLTLGYGKSETDPANEAILARLSLLLLLVLTNHCTTDSNPYREALFTCCDSHSDAVGGDQPLTGFKIEFAKIHASLCTSQNDDQTTLLLYLLLHRNPSFRTFVLSRTTDLDKLVVPMLKILYNSADRSSHHIYMALIVLLILTEDSLFNEAIHDTIMKNVIWYQDRHLTEISLGGLIILVIIRAIQFNISRTRDKFLHTNLLATLANMSNHFKRLNPYVCQKLITLFGKLSKKMNRSLNQLQSNYTVNGNGGEQSDRGSDHDTDIGSTSPDLMYDLSIYEEVLRMLLEIINSCLAAQLIHNPNLVYTLLYNRQVFEPFQANPSFQDIVMNIETVLTYFSNRIEQQQINDNSLSVAEIHQVIQNSSLQWPSDKLKKFPELKFRYVEDDQPEEFFIPYIWSLVYRSSSIYFNAQNILLFNPHRNVV